MSAGRSPELDAKLVVISHDIDEFNIELKQLQNTLLKYNQITATGAAFKITQGLLLGVIAIGFISALTMIISGATSTHKTPAEKSSQIMNGILIFAGGFTLAFMLSVSMCFLKRTARNRNERNISTLLEYDQELFNNLNLAIGMLSTDLKFQLDDKITLDNLQASVDALSQQTLNISDAGKHVGIVREILPQLSTQIRANKTNIVWSLFPTKEKRQVTESFNHTVVSLPIDISFAELHQNFHQDEETIPLLK